MNPEFVCDFCEDPAKHTTVKYNGSRQYSMCAACTTKLENLVGDADITGIARFFGYVLPQKKYHEDSVFHPMLKSMKLTRKDKKPEVKENE